MTSISVPSARRMRTRHPSVSSCSSSPRPGSPRPRSLLWPVVPGTWGPGVHPLDPPRQPQTALMILLAACLGSSRESPGDPPLAPQPALLASLLAQQRPGRRHSVAGMSFAAASLFPYSRLNFSQDPLKAFRGRGPNSGMLTSCQEKQSPPDGAQGDIGKPAGLVTITRPVTGLSVPPAPQPHDFSSLPFSFFLSSQPLHSLSP